MGEKRPSYNLIYRKPEDSNNSPILLRTDDSGPDWTFNITNKCDLEEYHKNFTTRIRRQFPGAGGCISPVSLNVFNFVQDYEKVKRVPVQTANFQEIQIQRKINQEPMFGKVVGKTEQKIKVIQLEIKKMLENAKEKTEKIAQKKGKDEANNGKIHKKTEQPKKGKGRVAPQSKPPSISNIGDYLNEFGQEKPCLNIQESIQRNVDSGGKPYLMNVHGSLCQDSAIFDLRCLSDLLDILRMKRHIIDGVNTPYIYISIAGTVFGFHLEDENLQSINFMWQVIGLKNQGAKIWIVIHLEDRDAFQELVKLFYATSNVCKNVITFKDVIPLDLEALGKAGIRFQVFEQKPGMLVVTTGIHGGVNLGNAINEAVNTTFLQWAGVNMIHNFDHLLKRTTRQECSCTCKYGKKTYIGAHRGRDFGNGMLWCYMSALQKFPDLKNGEKLVRICIIPEIIYHNYRSECDAIATLSQGSKRLRVRMIRFLRAITSQLLENSSNTTFNYQFWFQTRKEMGSIQMMPKEFSPFADFYESLDVCEEWAMDMANLTIEVGSKNRKFLKSMTKQIRKLISCDIEDLIKDFFNENGIYQSHRVKHRDTDEDEEKIDRNKRVKYQEGVNLYSFPTNADQQHQQQQHKPRNQITQQHQQQHRHTDREPDCQELEIYSPREDYDYGSRNQPRTTSNALTMHSSSSLYNREVMRKQSDQALQARLDSYNATVIKIIEMQKKIEK